MYRFSLTKRNVFLMKSCEWYSMLCAAAALHASTYNLIDCCDWLRFALILLHALLILVIDRRQTSSDFIQFDLDANAVQALAVHFTKFRIDDCNAQPTGRKLSHSLSHAFILMICGIH